MAEQRAGTDQPAPTAGEPGRTATNSGFGSEPLSLDELTTNSLWTTAADGLLIVDRSGTIRATNDALDRLFGYEPDEIVGNALEVLVPVEARERHVAHRTRFDAQPTDRPMSHGVHFRGLKADGATFPVVVGISHVDTLDGPMSVASIRDVSERERVEAQLALAKRRTAISETHDRIASDLHDTVIQRLFALGLGLQSEAESSTEETTAQVMTDAVDTIDDIIGEIREAIYGLRLAKQELGSTTDRILDVLVEMQPSLGLTPDLTVDPRVDDVEDAITVEHLCKVLREAISNVARHAAASEVRIDVSIVEQHLVLVVEDDGRGLSPPDTSPTDPDHRSASHGSASHGSASHGSASHGSASHGYGLESLRRRADGLGGSMSVSANVPSGTRLRWSVPVVADRDA